MADAVEHIGELLTRLQSPDFFEREQAVKELADCKQDEAVAGLVMALEDADLGIRELAANCLADIKGPTAAQLLIKFLANEDIGTRNLASEILVKIGGEAVPYLLEDLNNEDHDVRKFVVDTLGLIRDERAVEGLCNSLWDDNINVVCSAAEALGEIGSASAVPHLFAVTEKTPDATLQAMEALGKIGGEEPLEKLYTYLNSDDPMILYAAIESIGMIGSGDSVPHLKKMVNSSDRTIAEVTINALINISIKTGGRIDMDLPLDEFSDFLFDSIKKKDKHITEFILSRLNNWYGSNIIQGLLDALEYVEDDDLRRISEALAEIGPKVGDLIIEKLATAAKDLKLKLLDVLKQIIDDQLAEKLLVFVDDTEPEVRQKVVHTLGISGFPGAADVVQKLTSDPNGHVRAAAFSALGWLCTDKDVDKILSGLDDRYPDVREAAVGALIIIGGQRVVAKLTADLYHEDPERQRLAVTALGWIGEADVIEPLVNAINHPEAGVRKSAIKSLARIGGLGSTAPIEAALNDENSGVRKAAVSSLVSLAQRDAVQSIRFLLSDEDVWVRYHTMTCLGESGWAECSEWLIPHLEDEMDIIRIAAAKALAILGDHRAVPALNQLVDEENEDIAQTAKLALSEIEAKR